MTADLTPHPGWLAANLGPYGHELLLSLMAAGCMAFNNAIVDSWKQVTDDDIVTGEWVRKVRLPLRTGEVNAFFPVIADSDDPGWDLHEFWRAQCERYPYLAGITSPLTAWLENAPPNRLASIREVAATLARVDYYEMAAFAPGGILAETHNELVAIAERRGETVDFVPLTALTTSTMVEQLLEAMPSVPAGGSIGDLWCGPGNRLTAFALATTLSGRDASLLHYWGADHDPMAIAIAGVNLASLGMPNVHLAVSGEEQGDEPWPSQWAEASIDLLWTDLTEAADRVGASDVVQQLENEAFMYSRERDKMAAWRGLYAVGKMTESGKLALPMGRTAGGLLREEIKDNPYIVRHAMTKFEQGTCSCPPQKACPIHGGLKGQY